MVKGGARLAQPCLTLQRGRGGARLRARQRLLLVLLVLLLLLALQAPPLPLFIERVDIASLDYIPHRSGAAFLRHHTPSRHMWFAFGLSHCSGGLFHIVPRQTRANRAEDRSIVDRV